MVSAIRAGYQITGRCQGTGLAFEAGFWVELIGTQGAFNHHRATCQCRRIKLSNAPTRNARGTINATMDKAVFNPLSLIITKKLAIQGMKSVITTKLTTTPIGSNFPCSERTKNPAAP